MSLRAEILSELKSKDLAFLLIVSFALLTLWSFIVPVFEGPDEGAHWQFSRYLHDRWQLPYYDHTFVEANQPPLYYLLIAPFASATRSPPPGVYIDSAGQTHLLYPPRVQINVPGDMCRFWPVRMGRLVTALLSTLTVLFAFLTALEATGQRSAGLLAGTMVAALPQFTFRGMNISNDALVASTSAIAVYLIVRIARRGYDRETGAWFGVAFAFALLSKISAVFLPVPYGFAVLLSGSSWRAMVRDLFLKDRLKPFWPLAISAAIVAPWMIRNVVLYGDVFATRQMHVAVSNLMQPKSITSPYFTTVFPDALLHSFIGLFGAMNLPLPASIYRIFYALGTIAAVGLLWRLIRGGFALRLALVLSSVLVLTLVLVVQLNLSFTQPQGRYLFPALSAIAVLMAAGIEGLPGWRWEASVLLMAGLVFLNTIIACAIVYPAYWEFPTRPTTVPDLVVFDGLKGPARSLSSGEVLTQEIVPQHNGLARIEIMVATWSRRIPTGRLKATLKDVRSGELIAAWTILLDTISDNTFVPVELSPISDSGGKIYALDVEAQDVPAGHQVGIWLTQNDLHQPGRLLDKGKRVPHDLSFRTFFSPKQTFPASWPRQP